MAADSQSSGQDTLSSFPFLTNDEFKSACRAFLNRVYAAGSLAAGWSSIRFQEHEPVLTISQCFESDPCNPSPDDAYAQLSSAKDDHVSDLEACEEDPECFIRTFDKSGRLQVDYDIVFSPTYQVPVLYFVSQRMGKPLGIDEVYSHLVRDQYRKNIEGVGIMGGISFGYHPVSGTPAFFVHPCNTAEAMKDIASGDSVSLEAYLIVWLGLVGSCVRLQPPSELFATTGIPKLSG
ncbi:hypothetical protein BDV19DRAFT_61735 [Aspergillus venezuelensis]